MLRKVAGTVLTAFAFASAAFAADEAAMPDLLFKNTLRIQNRAVTSEIFVEPDHTWTSAAVTAFGLTSGTWEFRDGALCVTQTQPPQPSSPPRSFCEPLGGRKLGDAWETIDPRNGPIRKSLVAGRRPRLPSAP